MKSILPNWLYQGLCDEYGEDNVYEIRVRQNKPIQANIKGRIQEIKLNDNYVKKVVYANRDLISYIISAATKLSYYAFDDQIKQGFIATDNGIRIGICGEVVYDNGKLQTIKNITSLNIRIAHKIDGSSHDIMRFIELNGQVKNTLIASPPGAGKTTLLRDIISNLSKKDIKNILVCDERFELLVSDENVGLGKNVDIISGAKKQFVFMDGIKVMNPNVIAVDEISGDDDMLGVKFAVKSGVNIIATCHARNYEDLKSKPYLKELISDKYFERIVLLSKRNGVGTIEAVLDENGFAVYVPYLL